MLFEYLASYISTIVFLLPPFRQYGGRYFFYFLVLALGNPVGFLLILEAHLSPKKVFCIISWAMIVSLFNKNYLEKKYFLVITFSVVILCGTFFLENRMVQIITILIHLVIMFYFIKEAAQYYSNNYAIHLGYFILVLYEMGLISKFYLSISNIHAGMIYFYLTGFFEILIAVFFTIYMVEKSPVIELKRND